MRRFFRFVGLAAGVGAIVYLMRDRMVRIPEEAGPPPHFRTASPNGEAEAPLGAGRVPAAEGAVDDLTAIKGIGPVYAERLRGAGIETFTALASADVAATAGAIDVAEEQLADWVDQARQRLS